MCKAYLDAVHAKEKVLEDELDEQAKQAALENENNQQEDHDFRKVCPDYLLEMFCCNLENS